MLLFKIINNKKTRTKSIIYKAKIIRPFKMGYILRVKNLDFYF